MTKEEKIKKVELLKRKSSDLKKEVDYYNALQLALKLVLNGSYGAFATSYFILYNNKITFYEIHFSFFHKNSSLLQSIDKYALLHR